MKVRITIAVEEHGYADTYERDAEVPGSELAEMVARAVRNAPYFKRVELDNGTVTP